MVVSKKSLSETTSQTDFEIDKVGAVAHDIAQTATKSCDDKLDDGSLSKFEPVVNAAGRDTAEDGTYSTASQSHLPKRKDSSLLGY